MRTVFTFPLLALCLLISFVGAGCGFVYTIFMSGVLWGNHWAVSFANYVRGVEQDEDVVDRTPYIAEENRRIAAKAKELGWPWCKACQAFHSPLMQHCPDYDWDAHAKREQAGLEDEGTSEPKDTSK